METVQTEATAGSRLGTVETELAVLKERVTSMGGVVETNETRVDKLRQFMWKAMGVIGFLSMIPLGKAIIEMASKQ